VAPAEHGPRRFAWRVIAGRPRLWAGFICGLAMYLLLPTALALQTRLLLAWNLGVLVFLSLAALLFATRGAAEMPADAERQEEGEWTIFWLTLAAVTFSFVAIFGQFVAAKDMHGVEKDLHVGLVVLTLALSWLMMNTTFAMRYAHEYYDLPDGSATAAGGLEFPGEDRPDYWDFLYFSLVIGMTFQVSDVQITARTLRRLAAVHGLLSFVFNTTILALTVNIAAGLL
jgi:uncharacterized membrane protein